MFRNRLVLLNATGAGTRTSFFSVRTSQYNFLAFSAILQKKKKKKTKQQYHCEIRMTRELRYGGGWLAALVCYSLLSLSNLVYKTGKTNKNK